MLLASLMVNPTTREPLFDSVCGTPSTSSSVLVNSGSPRGNPRSITDSKMPSCVLMMAPGTCATACVSVRSPRLSIVARSMTSVCAATLPTLTGSLVAVTGTRSMKLGVASNSAMIVAWPAASTFGSRNSRKPAARITRARRPATTPSSRNRPMALVAVFRLVLSTRTSAPAIG
jgi:hypothetical protein